jgi:uncharacterized protein (UPF0297 family)
MIRRILALWRIYRRPKPPRRKIDNCIEHLREDPIYIPRHRDEIADLQNDTHIENLVQMRRELRETKL